MFFSITKVADQNFVSSTPMGNLYLNTDSGWTSVTQDDQTIVYKGYVNDFDLASNLNKVNCVPELDGNFCVISYCNNEIKITHNKKRTFPLYYSTGSCITNLHKQNDTIWANELVTIDQNLNIKLSKFDPIGTIDSSTLAEELIVDSIHSILENKIQKFLSHYQGTIKVFLTGGVDSMLVFSFIKKLTNNYELVTCLHTDFDKFWCKNQFYIQKNYEFYKQIHHWTSPSVLASGAWGDETLLRSPITGNLLLMSYNTNVPKLFVERTDDFQQRKYFSLPSSQDVFTQQLADKKLNQLVTNREVLYKHLCRIMLNDYQHWHLGNTLTYTPLHDLEIFKLLLRLPKESVIGQMLDSTITKQLIEKNDPNLLAYLSPAKNHESFSVLWDYLESCIV